MKSSQVKSSQVKSSQLYGNAKPIQADDGSGRGPARGLLRWAKESVGSGDHAGDRRCRASTALIDRARPFSDEFWRFGPDKGTSIDFGQATRAAGAAAAKEWSRSFLRCARATHPALHFLRMPMRHAHMCASRYIYEFLFPEISLCDETPPCLMSFYIQRLKV